MFRYFHILPSDVQSSSSTGTMVFRESMCFDEPNHECYTAHLKNWLAFIASINHYVSAALGESFCKISLRNSHQENREIGCH